MSGGALVALLYMSPVGVGVGLLGFGLFAFGCKSLFTDDLQSSERPRTSREAKV